MKRKALRNRFLNLNPILVGSLAIHFVWVGNLNETIADCWIVNLKPCLVILHFDGEELGDGGQFAANAR